MKDFEPGACQSIQEHLDSYLGGEIPAPMKDAISLHLDECPRCAEQFQTRLRVRGLLKGAVLRGAVPPHLEARIRALISGSRKERRSLWVWVPAFAVAAALLIAFLAGWVGLRQPSDPRLMTAAARQHYVDSLFESVVAIIRVGLGNHLHCTYFAQVREGAAPAEEMVEQMGPEYSALIPLVQEKVPAEYVIATAHRCTYHGRRFVHMVLRGEGKLLSLVITRREPGESFAESNLPVMQTVGGVPIYQSGAERFEIAGFESAEHLAFVVSDLNQRDNLAWAASLASPVHRFLTDDEG